MEVDQPGVGLIRREIVADIDIGGRALPEVLVELAGKVGIDQWLPLLTGSSRAG